MKHGKEGGNVVEKNAGRKKLTLVSDDNWERGRMVIKKCYERIFQNYRKFNKVDTISFMRGPGEHT